MAIKIKIKTDNTHEDNSKAYGLKRSSKGGTYKSSGKIVIKRTKSNSTPKN